MKDNSLTMAEQKTIAIVAHDNKKQDLLAWAKFNRGALDGHNLIATGTTGKLLHTELGLAVTRLQSGPLGGDQQIGAKISEGKIDILIFFWDPLEPHPHDPMSKRSSASPWFGTFPSPATGPRPIFSFRPRSCRGSINGSCPTMKAPQSAVTSGCCLADYSH
jgi:hypothetical protein